MKKIFFALACSLLLICTNCQSQSAISSNNLQYIKDYFFLNFIKTPVNGFSTKARERFNYEITDAAIIIYKTELSQNNSEIENHWYYLPLSDIKIQINKSKMDHFGGAHALWFERKQGSTPHGLGKKFTKIVDAVNLSSSLLVPFKYNYNGDLDKLISIFDNPAQKTNIVTTKPAATNKENYQFTSLSLGSLYGIADQLDHKNRDAVMQAKGYTLKPQPAGKTEAFHYEQKDKRTVILADAHSDTATLYILKVPILGMELEEIIKDLEENGIEFVGKENEETIDNYYFAAPKSVYTFRIEVDNNGWSNYVYLFKIIEKKKTKALNLEPEFAFINMASISKLDSAMNSFTLKGKHYTAKNKRDVAAFFNGHMYKAENQGAKNAAPFAILGKTDFTKKSIAFTVKDDLLFIKLNIPLNGTCDYGLKEIKARHAGISQVNGTAATKGYLVNFKYDYSCEGINYKYLTVYIADSEGVSLNAIKMFLQAQPE